MRVLILTDSLSLPRKLEQGFVDWDEVYFSRLKKRFPDVDFILVGMGGATITQIFLAMNYYVYTKPDLIILQAGIVDCAPRALGQFEQQIISKLRLFRLVSPFTKFLRKFRGISYTSPPAFEETLLKLKNTFPQKPFISIGILPGSDGYEALVPGISGKIKLYNNILKKNTEFIDNQDFPVDAIHHDFYHLNKFGHELIFNKLEPMVTRYANELNLRTDFDS